MILLAQYQPLSLPRVEPSSSEVRRSACPRLPPPLLCRTAQVYQNQMASQLVRVGDGQILVAPPMRNHQLQALLVEPLFPRKPLPAPSLPPGDAPPHCLPHPQRDPPDEARPNLALAPAPPHPPPRSEGMSLSLTGGTCGRRRECPTLSHRLARLDLLRRLWFHFHYRCFRLVRWFSSPLPCPHT